MAISADPLTLKIAEALGIDPGRCTGITIRLRPAHTPVVVVGMIPDTDDQDSLVDELRTYRLVPIEDE